MLTYFYTEDERTAVQTFLPDAPETRSFLLAAFPTTRALSCLAPGSGKKPGLSFFVTSPEFWYLITSNNLDIWFCAHIHKIRHGSPIAATRQHNSAILGLALQPSISTSIPLLTFARLDNSLSDNFFCLRNRLIRRDTASFTVLTSALLHQSLN